MEPRRLAAGQLGPLCIHALNRRSGRRAFPRPPFSRESDRLQVRGWRDPGPRRADGPRGQSGDPRPEPARVHAEWAAARRGGSGGRESPRAAAGGGGGGGGRGGSDAGRGGWGEGQGGFPFSPKSALLITRVIIQQVPQPSAWLSSHACAFPRKQTRLLPRAPAKQPHPEYFGGGGGGEERRSGYLRFQKNAHSTAYVKPHDRAGIRPLST